MWQKWTTQLCYIIRKSGFKRNVLHRIRTRTCHEKFANVVFLHGKNSHSTIEKTQTQHQFAFHPACPFFRGNCQVLGFLHQNPQPNQSETTWGDFLQRSNPSPWKGLPQHPQRRDRLLQASPWNRASSITTNFTWQQPHDTFSLQVVTKHCRNPSKSRVAVNLHQPVKLLTKLECTNFTGNRKDKFVSAHLRSISAPLQSHVCTMRNQLNSQWSRLLIWSRLCCWAFSKIPPHPTKRVVPLLN